MMAAQSLPTRQIDVIVRDDNLNEDIRVSGMLRSNKRSLRVDRMYFFSSPFTLVYLHFHYCTKMLTTQYMAFVTRDSQHLYVYIAH